MSQDTAINLFSRAIEKKLFNRVDCMPLIACVVYTASRISNQSIWLGYVAIKSGIPRAALGHLYQILRDSLSLNPGRVLPEHLVFRVSSAMKVHPRHIGLITKLCRIITDNSLVGSACPQTTAVAVIIVVVYAAGETVDLSVAASSSLLSAQVINKAYIALRPIIQDIIPQLTDPINCSNTNSSDSSITSRNISQYQWINLPECLEKERVRKGVADKNLKIDMEEKSISKTNRSIDKSTQVNKVSSDSLLNTELPPHQSEVCLTDLLQNTSSVPSQSSSEKKLPSPRCSIRCKKELPAAYSFLFIKKRKIST